MDKALQVLEKFAGKPWKGIFTSWGYHANFQVWFNLTTPAEGKYLFLRSWDKIFPALAKILGHGPDNKRHCKWLHRKVEWLRGARSWKRACQYSRGSDNCVVLYFPYKGDRVIYELRLWEGQGWPRMTDRIFIP